jgi:uncharacterized protein (TIGR03118 family)
MRKLLPTLTTACLLGLATHVAAQGYKVTPLVTDDPSVLATLGYGPAATVDPNLINPWGFDHSPTGPWVVANAFSGTVASYNGAGQVQGPAVATPQNGAGGPAGPTGLVYTGGLGFSTSGGAGAQYVVSNLDGSLSTWDGSSASTQVAVTGRSGLPAAGNLAVYTGLAVGSTGGANYLYAANGITGQIDVFNASFGKATLTGNFTDPGLNPSGNPLGLVPFNVQTLDGHVWVTYAAPGPPADNQPLGSGFVSEFNLDGTFVRRFADGGGLSSPWGIAIAPSDFGAYSNDVLIGNFNDDTRSEEYISAYDPTSGQFLGELSEDGSPILLPGLWGLEFGNDAGAGPSNTLYFVAGIGDEGHGLFGSISAAPEPETWAMMILGFGLSGGMVRRRRLTRAAH